MASAGGLAEELRKVLMVRLGFDVEASTWVGRVEVFVWQAEANPRDGICVTCFNNHDRALL